MEWIKKGGKTIDTKCWTCTAPGTRRCCWDDSKGEIPVPGWTAIKTPVSYHVISCPLYEKCPTSRNKNPASRQSRLSDEQLRAWMKEGVSDWVIHLRTGLQTSTIANRKRKLKQQDEEDAKERARVRSPQERRFMRKRLQFIREEFNTKISGRTITLFTRCDGGDIWMQNMVRALNSIHCSDITTEARFRPDQAPKDKKWQRWEFTVEGILPAELMEDE